MFLTQMHHFASEGPQSCVEHFICFKISTPIPCHYKALKSQDIFLYNFDCIHLKEESCGLRVSKGEGGTIPIHRTMPCVNLVWMYVCVHIEWAA